MQTKSPEFDECVRKLKSSDSLTYEEGFHWLQGYIDGYINELVQLMLEETNPDIRSRFVELVGSSKKPQVIPFLEAELKSPDSEVRSWAYSSLLYFENPKAIRIAEIFKEENPNEEFL